MKLIIRTDARNIEHLIKRNNLYLEGTTEKMCMVSGQSDKIKSIKSDLDSTKYAYFDYQEKEATIPDTRKKIVNPTKNRTKKKT